MSKPKLLYASPFPPMKSGISDYSEIMVFALKDLYEITLFIDDYALQNKRLYDFFDIIHNKKDKVDFNNYPNRIYNIGNNPEFHRYIYDIAIKYPGLIILHDFILYYLCIGCCKEKNILYSTIYKMCGAKGIHLIKQHIKNRQDLLECKHLAHHLPLNLEILQSKNKIMTHSLYTYNKVYNIIKDKRLLRKINHIQLIPERQNFIDKRELLTRFHIDHNAIIIGSFGSIDPTKLNHVVCKTIEILNQQFRNRLVYLMVGEGPSANEYLSANIKKTGHVNLLEFNSFIKHADIVVNLRSPSMGETSGTLIRALELGKPCIVSNDAWFAELPDEVVVKIENENAERELYEKLRYLLMNSNGRKALSHRATEYIKSAHNAADISMQIGDFLNYQVQQD